MLQKTMGVLLNVHRKLKILYCNNFFMGRIFNKKFLLQSDLLKYLISLLELATDEAYVQWHGAW